MKPDKPGEWHSRTRKIVVYHVAGYLHARYLDSQDEPKRVCDLPDDDWRQCTPPEFPELPPRPKLVLTTYSNIPKPKWRAVPPDHGMAIGWITPDELASATVVPHPDNDPEAVRMIEEARKK